MVSIETVDSLDHPRLVPYRTMRRQEDHEGQGVFVAEGGKVVRRLITSHFSILSLLIQPEFLEEFSALLESRPEQVQIFVAEKSVLERLTGYPLYQGVLALAKIPFQPREIRAGALNLNDGLVVALDGLASAENLGVVVRNAAAFGATALLVGENCVSPYLRRAVRNSMGAIFGIPVVLSTNLGQDLERLFALGVRRLAAHPHHHRRLLSQAEWTGPTCLVLGSEGHGIRPEILERCDEWIAIPMARGVDSLNVASASAVFFHEWSRGRTDSVRQCSGRAG